MSQKSHFKYYVAITSDTATVVDYWLEAQALTSRKSRGKVKGAETFTEAEIHLNELIAERDHSAKFKRKRWG